MMLFNYIVTALRQLHRNTGRSFLTMLGIVIGIGSVIFILSTGELAKQFLLGQVTQFGTDVVEVVSPGTFGPGAGSLDTISLTDKDIQLVQDSPLLPEVTTISAGTFISQTLEYENESTNVTVDADLPDYFTVNHREVGAGRFYTQQDEDTFAKVLVVEETFAKNWFGSAKAAVGQEVKLGGKTFRVIGVMKQGSAVGSFGFGEVVYAPLTTIKQLFGDPKDLHKLDYMLVGFAEGTEVESFQNRLTFVLNSAHDLLNSDTGFTIQSRQQALSIFNNVLLGIQLFVSAVASISLLVGGIGIMNIMLVTVTERTKEIGLRKAIGAKNYSILTQFLVESVVLTTVGGFIGIGSGLGLTELGVLALKAFKPEWGIQFVFVPSALALACGVIVTLGVVFGVYPAIKASRLSPMEALRYE